VFCLFFPLLTYFVEALKTHPYSSDLQKKYVLYKWGQFLFENFLKDFGPIVFYFEESNEIFFAPFYHSS